MDIDVSKIKPGDEVTIRAFVDERAATPSDGRDFVSVRISGSLTIVRAMNIVSHTPKALAVGDRVRVDCHVGVFTIEGVSNHGHGPNYWCVRPLPNLKYVTAHHSVVDRLDQ